MVRVSGYGSFLELDAAVTLEIVLAVSLEVYAVILFKHDIVVVLLIYQRGFLLIFSGLKMYVSPGFEPLLIHVFETLLFFRLNNRQIMDELFHVCGVLEPGHVVPNDVRMVQGGEQGDFVEEFPVLRTLVVNGDLLDRVGVRVEPVLSLVDLSKTPFSDHLQLLELVHVPTSGMLLLLVVLNVVVYQQRVVRLGLEVLHVEYLLNKFAVNLLFLLSEHVMCYLPGMVHFLPVMFTCLCILLSMHVLWAFLGLLVEVHEQVLVYGSGGVEDEAVKTAFLAMYLLGLFLFLKNPVQLVHFDRL